MDEDIKVFATVRAILVILAVAAPTRWKRRKEESDAVNKIRKETLS